MKFSLPLKDEPHVEKQHCCVSMSEQTNMHSRVAAGKLLGPTDKRIYWSPLFDEYGLIGQPSPEVLVISNCPFCGAELPQSKRSAWFSALEARGWETWGDPIPAFMFDPTWEAACQEKASPIENTHPCKRHSPSS